MTALLNSICKITLARNVLASGCKEVHQLGFEMDEINLNQIAVVNDLFRRHGLTTSAKSLDKVARFNGVIPNS